MKVEFQMEERVLIYKVEVHFLYRCDKLKVEFEMEECVLIYRYRKMKVEFQMEECVLIYKVEVHSLYSFGNSGKENASTTFVIEAIFKVCI